MSATPQIELEVSPVYIKQQQTEGAYDKMAGKSPECPDCPYYMQGYTGA